MQETAEDVRALQALLDASYARGGAHLKSILLGDRRIGAEELCELLKGMQLLSLATVNARCEPMVSPVDGHFHKGVWYFGSSPDSVRYRHIVGRPQVSANHARGEDLVVVVHGTAELVDIKSPEHAGFRDQLVQTYGSEWMEFFESAFYARINARVMFASRLPVA